MNETKLRDQNSSCQKNYLRGTIVHHFTEAPFGICVASIPTCRCFELLFEFFSQNASKASGKAMLRRREPF